MTYGAQVDWEAIGAIATTIAAITALIFGFRDAILGFLTLGKRRSWIATATIHAIQIAANQCDALSKILEPERLPDHRARLNELGRAMEFTTVASLTSHGKDIEIFGDRPASAYWYAVSLMEDTNIFGRWLAELPAPSDAQWASLLEQFAVARESASQAKEALKIAEAAVKPHIPEEIMRLRFGNPPQ